MATTTPSPHFSSLALWRSLWPYLTKYRGLMLGAVVALLVASGMVLGVGQALKQVIDQGLAAGQEARLDYTLLIMLSIALVLALATYARFSMVTWLGERVVADLRSAIFTQILRLDVSYFEVNRTGDVLARLSTDTTLIQNVIGSAISVALRNILLLLGGIGLMATASLKLTGLILLVVPLVVVPILLTGRRVRAASRLSQDKLAEVNVTAEETIYGIKTVQAFAQEPAMANQFMTANQASLRAAKQRIHWRAGLTATVILLVFSAITFVLWQGGHDVLAGTMSPGQLSAFIFYAVLVAGAVGAITEVIGDLGRAAGALQRINELLAVTPKILPPIQAQQRLPQPSLGTVDFTNITFAYPSRPSQPILQNFSLSVASGEKLAIVGSSGSGKSTLFQLLLRFYDPQSGQVQLDGLPLPSLDPQELRQQIGLVAQEPMLFSTTAAANIAYGKPNATEAEIVAAAEAANAHDFISALPHGYATYLGEKGVQLSGGQRQRIAIARTILRNPRVLLLDEATSALDAENEQLVQQALTKLMANRTTLVIAHRLSTIQNCDRIIVLDQGRIMESGTHAALLQQNGLYAHFVRLQQQK